MEAYHTFHIPVMGTCFSIDTPLKVAKYGISSVISLVDDCLIEDMRKYYCEQIGEEYRPITKDDEDCRANRITAYLNLVDRIVKEQVEEVKQAPFEPDSDISKYFEMLPETSSLKSLYRIMLNTSDAKTKLELQNMLRDQVKAGDIDVNIMTKLDKPNYEKDGAEKSAEFSDALAALRGYARSTLSSAIVFSAGINRRLYSYVENFKDFYADAKGFMKKRIVLKVSDFRSSITQGKFFAKKGLWVSEYRVESGLNCGGHAFPSEGYLMGPILEEFKSRKQEMIATLHKLYSEACKLKNRITFLKPHKLRITAQGGIGTAEENKFLFEHYGVDGTGWATPFLLVPEVTNVDQATLEQLSKAEEDDLYLSDVSPLGVPFNNLRNSASDAQKEARIQNDQPGSSCPKGYLCSNTEFTTKPICTASRQYQDKKIKQLKAMNLDVKTFWEQYRVIVQKACICNELGDAVYLKNNISKKAKELFPAICPGPNLAYFSKISTLKEMIDHIYGRINLLNGKYRPHMFLKELHMYIECLKKEAQKAMPRPTDKQIKYFIEFRKNLFEGIEYYRKLFAEKIDGSQEYRQRLLKDLNELTENLIALIDTYQMVFLEPVGVRHTG